jgi:hypothetical protein
MKKAIAVDFDGCLCVNAYPDIGKPNWAVIERAKAEQAAGAGLILWTCREGELLQNAVAAAASWGLTFDALNDSLPEWKAEWGNAPRKVGATEYWDDRALRAGVFGVDPPLQRGGWMGYETSTLLGHDEGGEPIWSPRHFYRCSCCGRGSAVQTKYCPGCGAKMEV